MAGKHMTLVLRSFPAWMIVLACTTTACRSAGAQDRFLGADGGPVPDTYVERDGSPWRVWVADRGYRPRYEYHAGSRVVANRTAEFMEAFLVYSHHIDQQSKKEYFFLANPGMPFGWVDGEVVVRNINPLIDDVTDLEQKLFIVNTRDSLRKLNLATEPDRLKAVELTDGPRNSAEKRNESYLASLFFVYAETADYLLVGKGSRFDPKNPTAVVQGWIPANRASRWNHRMALEWRSDVTFSEPSLRPSNADGSPYARRTEEGRVFTWYHQEGDRVTLVEDEAVKLAKEFITGQIDAGRLESGTGFLERFDVKDQSIVMPWEDMRMPIIENPRQFPFPANNGLYKVGWVGGFGGGVIDPELKNKLERAIRAAGLLEVLIVIDHTGSMKRYFPEVASAIGRIYLGFQGTEERDIRMSVCFYGDDGQGAKAFDVLPLESIAGGGAQNPQLKAYIQQYLEAVKKGGASRTYFSNQPPPFPKEGTVVELMERVHSHVAPEGGRGSREQVFSGLRSAISSAGFKPYAQKLVILVGDMGDKSGEGAENPAQLLRTQVVNDLFPSGEMPISFYVIHKEEREGRRHDDAILFETQAKWIVDQVNLRNRAATPGAELEMFADFFPSTSKDSVETAVNDRYQVLRRQAKAIQDNIDAIKAGRKESTAVGPAERRLLQYYGVDVDKLAQLGAQEYAEGFVWSYDRKGIPLVRTRVLLDDKEIETIVNTLDPIVGVQRGGNKPNALGPTAAAVIEAAAGELGTEKTLLDVTDMRRLRIPGQSKLMQLTPAQLREYLAEPRNTEELALKLARLKDIRGGVAHDWYFSSEKVDKTGVEDRILSFTKKETVDRQAKIDSDSDALRSSPFEKKAARIWYWVDLETELP